MPDYAHGGLLPTHGGLSPVHGGLIPTHGGLGPPVHGSPNTGPSLGPELLTNGDFSSAVGWSIVGGGPTISGGSLNTGLAAFEGASRPWNTPPANGEQFRCVVEVTSLGTGVSPRVDIGPSWGPSVWVTGQVLVLGTNTFDFTVATGDPAAQVLIQNYTSGSVQAVINSISLKKLS